MENSKLFLSLLLTTLTLSYAQEDHSTCLINQRYKAFHKYEYLYNAESLNAINGASHLRNGPKATCKVEIEVPQTCSFIVRTTGCSLSEVVDMDPEGNPVFSPAASSDAFAAEMEKYPLKVVVDGVYDVKLYPEDGETTTILNIKRGIISALAVPLLEEEKNKNMPTIHGMCKTQYSINTREDIATDISLTRDLSRCDKFVPMRDYTSPLALISGMHYPLSKLIRSTQNCNYKFDNEKQHMTSGSCTENHILIPFSHRGEYGVTNVGKQDLTLVQVSSFTDEVFDRSNIVKGLHMETVEDKSVIQDKDAGLTLLGELAALPESEGDRRAHLFKKLVTMVRGMKAETLSPAIPEALAVSRVLTYQVLAQCGTPECSSAIMQIFRTLDASSLEVDAGVFALGLVSNPSPLLINDMLEMAKFKPSKPIMYALSNVVKRFYKAEGKLIPEINAVAEFMAEQLGDCTGDKDKTFITLRVIGNMAAAVGPASPTLRTAVIQCVNQPEAPLSVQQAAIQAYRLTAVPEEGREVLMQVLLDGASPMQKRIAAYLVLMKDPQPSELAQLAAALPIEQDSQVKSFVISHVTNILSSTAPETLELRQKIIDALQGNEVGPIMDPTKFSSHYKIGSVEGNVIFEGPSYLPKEVMLEMTLKAFGYDIDMMEIGMQGTGFEPTVDALFGEHGFFPDTALKTMYFVSDKMPLDINEILKNVMPTLKTDRMKRQASQSLMRDIGRNLNKLVRELKTSQTPEAMVYMRLLGNELGYLRTNEITDMAYSAALMVDNMFKMFPTELLKALMTKADNTIFAHYIFMDNEFFLPTATGVPLRIALSGTFTPGIKGGLKFGSDMSEVSFMPSAGVEFHTRVGSFISEYVKSGLEMHTSIFHESGLTAKISLANDNVKLTIPAPMHPTKIIKMKNALVSVTGSGEMPIPPMITDMVDVSECTPFFAGMKYCTALQYTDAFSQETAPYFPFTGDSKFAMELHPTGEVTEFTATLAYELLREGEEGRQKVDSVKFVLRAEGAEPTEATAMVKYNRRKNVITADIQIPDYDMEAGLRLGVVDGNTKGKGTHSISLDLINKNIPQLSLIGRANLKAMKEGMLQVQLLVPSISADATLTANLKHDEDFTMVLKSNIKISETTSEQKISMKYGTSNIEVELKSDVNSGTLNTLPYTDRIRQYGNDMVELKVGKTDKTVGQIFSAFMEEANKHLEVYAADIPYIQNFRMPDMPEISLPESLYLNTEAKAIYYFNNERFTISIPLPLGGKSTEELNFPPALTTPNIFLPMFGLNFVSTEIPIPELFVPESLTLALPLFGKAEVSTLMKSNFYNMEASMAAGKDVVETPSYSAKFDVTGTSPLDILSVKMEGSGMLATTDAIKAQLKSSLVHKFIEASINVVEEATITDKINLKSSSKIEAKSPLGVRVALEHTGMAGVNTEEISADSNLEGMWTVGPAYSKVTATQSFTIAPFKPEAKIDSSVQIDSTIVNTLTNTAELSFKESKLSLKSETNAAHTENRVYSLLTASLDVDGLTVNSDATVKLLEKEATHKATLTMNKDGLITSGTTALQSALALENTFNAALDASKASLSINNKAVMQDIKVDNANTLTITLSGLDFNSKAEATASEHASYTHDVTIDLKPFTASANVNNNLKVLAANIVNEAQLKAELYKIDLTGSLKAIYGEEEIKHIYQVNYADMAANAKCSTTGTILGTHMSHNTELEVIGLAARITNDARFNSQPIRFDHSIRCSVVPFDFNLDAIFNADGDMTMYGKHSAQLYGKWLLKAQPLAVASAHECRASVTQQLDNGFSLETTFDNKMDNVLSLQEQKSSFRLKSKVNDHSLSQDLSIYNTADRTGLEVSGTILTNILNGDSTENQEFTLSGFLKYDKNTDSHVIQIPFVDNLPVLLESIKGLVYYVGEALQGLIDNEEIMDKIAALPQYVEDFISELNIEGKVNQLKKYLNDISQEYVISMEDLEVILRTLKAIVEKKLSNFSVYIQNIVGMVKDIIVATPETLVQNTLKLVEAFTEEFDIKAMIINMIDTMKDMAEQFDLEKLKGSSIAFLNDIDATYEIKAKLQIIMSLVKEIVLVFDMQVIVEKVKNIISSIDFNARIDELVSKLPTEIFGSITDTIREIVLDFDILHEINNVYANIRELIVKFEIESKVQAIFEKVMELIKQLKVDETVTALVKMFNDADISTKFLQVFQGTVKYLSEADIKDIIAELNGCIQIIEQKLNSLDYNDFVAEANQVIVRCTAFVNDLIVSLEIQQKLEAIREFSNLGLSFISGAWAHLREIKITEIVQDTKDILDQVVLNNLKKFAIIIKQEIENLDINAKMTYYLQLVMDQYTEFITVTSDIFTSVAQITKKPKIVQEVLQIIQGLLTGLTEAELTIPSFTIPLTDLVVPSMKFSRDALNQFEVQQELDIPEFTIMGVYTVKATTISMNDIQQRFNDLIASLFDLPMKLFEIIATFEELIMSYIPTLPEFSIPEMTIPEFSFPTLPNVQAEKLVKTLQLPPFKLPEIPHEIMIPGFGKLSYEIKVNTPIYTIRNAAEVQSSLDVDSTPQLTAFLTSQGTSTNFEILNFNLDSTARVAIPMGGLIAAETLKFTHGSLMVDHDASVTFSYFSAQVSAKTTVKSTTGPYDAELLNEAFLATNGGLSATSDTSYKHVLNLPIMGLAGETSIAQKAAARQEGYAITITVDNQGTATLNSQDNTLKSALQVTINPSLHDMKLELKGTHSTDLTGMVNGDMYNMIDVALGPGEFLFSLQNKGNSKVNLNDALAFKFDLQNDYSATFRPDTQHMNTVALAHLNQFKVLWNLTLENNEKEAAILGAAEGEANLDFLTKPISIPEINIPFLDLKTPAIRHLNLYDQTGLKYILTTTDQAVNLGAKLVFEKSQDTLLVEMIQIPFSGNLITDLSFKSPIINVNANAGLYTGDDLVFRLGATTASVFDSLKAKLDGTTSLTTKRGIKLANSLSFENQHIEGTHDSTVAVSTETLETTVSVATVAKIALPILNLEAKQNLAADTKTKPNAVSTWTLKGDFNIPVIKAVGKAEIDHSLKLEGTFEYVSMETSTKTNMENIMLEDCVVSGVLDNEINLVLNNDGLRSASKVLTDAKLNYGTTKVIGMDVNESLEVEASLSRVYGVLKYSSNNEANMFNFNTNGKHAVQTTIDFAPKSLFTTDIEIDISQLSSLGDLTIFDKTVAEVTAAEQKISTNIKFVSPLYTTNLAAELDGSVPVYKADFKSSATSTMTLLEYDLDSSVTLNIEDAGLTLTGKGIFTHSDMNMDIQHILSHTVSDSRLTLSVDITSPAFTDINVRYTLRKDGTSCTISIPSTGFLGLQLHGRVPAQMNARLYGRYASDPGKDVDIVTIRASVKDTDKMNLKMVINMEAPDIILSGIQERLPAITSSMSGFAEKYHLSKHAAQLKNFIIYYIEEAHNIAYDHTPDLSHVSILYRNTVVQYQKTVQAFLDAAINFMRDTQVRLPGSQEMVPLIEVLNKMTTSITTWLEKAFNFMAVNVEYAFNVVIDTVSEIQVTMPIGDVMASAKIIDEIRERVSTMFNHILTHLKHPESIDIILENWGTTLKNVVEKAQEWVDNTLKSDVLDVFSVFVNAFYREYARLVKTITKYADTALDIEFIKGTVDYILDIFRSAVNQFNQTVSDCLHQATAQIKFYVKVQGKKLEINV
ncbi:apolipoprotein B-100-like [Notolabrus celidotus]|uniref:apolipoprotein B-100-like n=1 Tax=Notolabrus celidotus TaxID=1203425 RepID=UPI00148F9B5B|nr:apolipoprotein B-100-like [Notolabrus celidotus]